MSRSVTCRTIFCFVGRKDIRIVCLKEWPFYLNKSPLNIYSLLPASEARSKGIHKKLENSNQCKLLCECVRACVCVSFFFSTSINDLISYIKKWFNNLWNTIEISQASNRILLFSLRTILLTGCTASTIRHSSTSTSTNCTTNTNSPPPSPLLQFIRWRLCIYS